MGGDESQRRKREKIFREIFLFRRKTEKEKEGKLDLENIWRRKILFARRRRSMEKVKVTNIMEKEKLACIHAKSWRFWRYISANFFGFSAKF